MFKKKNKKKNKKKRQLSISSIVRVRSPFSCECDRVFVLAWLPEGEIVVDVVVVVVAVVGGKKEE